MSVGWPEVVGSAAVMGLAGFAALQVSRLPKVWRGESLMTLPWPNYHGPEVNHRSFPVFTAFITCLGAGALMVWISIVWDIEALAIAGGLTIIFGAGVFVPIWIVVNAVNRPRLLVPPARRGEPGWWGEWRVQRQRRRSGLAPTDHVVEILDVRPPPGDSYDPYFVAVCSVDDCGWTSAPFGKDEAHPDPEAAVRSEATGHSPHLIGPRRPLG